MKGIFVSLCTLKNIDIEIIWSITGKLIFFPIKMALKQPYKLKYNSMIVGVHAGLTGVLRGKRAQINLMNWPKGLVHIRHHHIMLINILPGKPLTAFIFIRSKLSNSRGGIFFFFLTTVHLGAVKAANYCHHCPWKCITPHLRAHSIKETEGAINRWPPTFIERKNHPNKSWMRRLSRFHVANVLTGVSPQAQWCCLWH